jgi:hypothetical protein
MSLAPDADAEGATGPTAPRRDGIAPSLTGSPKPR